MVKSRRLKWPGNLGKVKNVNTVFNDLTCKLQGSKKEREKERE